MLASKGAVMHMGHRGPVRTGAVKTTPQLSISMATRHVLPPMRASPPPSKSEMGVSGDSSASFGWRCPDIAAKVGRIGLGLAATLAMGTTMLVPPSTAITEEQIIFLEGWRALDRAYVDKGFNGQSWFKYRETALKKDPMNDRDETYAAIEKMVASLDDPFTRFLPPNKYATLRQSNSSKLTGVGVEVTFDDKENLVVVAPAPGGPADRAGVQPKDVVVSVDGVATKGLSLYDAAQLLQGPEGTDVTFEISRRGKKQVLPLVREKIVLNPVSSALCAGPGVDIAGAGVGYIKLGTFNARSADKVRLAVKELQEGGAKSFVLDLRNNSGGSFPAGIDIARMFINDGDIVLLADTIGAKDIIEAGNNAIAKTEGMSVLVNKGTASAAEVLTGALQDNKRATVVGAENTFGKGLIQSTVGLSDGSAINVTVAKYQTPAGIDINKVGITPDIDFPVEDVPNTPDKFCELLAANDGLSSRFFF